MVEKRNILHLDLDTFFVSVERLLNPKLVNRPLLIGNTSSRGVVASCSYEARNYGIKSGMSMRWALRLCPNALVVRGDIDRYQDFSKIITEVIMEEAPVFEKASLDEFYLDLSGIDRFHSTYLWANELRNKIINESGLPLSFALASNKTVSKMGSREAKPNGRLHIANGKEASFLAPFAVCCIPGVGEHTGRRLNLMGIKKIKELRQVPETYLIREFGKVGKDIYLKSFGKDPSPVQPFQEQKSISAERTFSHDTIDITSVKSLLTKLCEQLCFDLRAQNKLCSLVSVKIRYSDHQTFQKQKKVIWTAGDKDIQHVAEKLFDSLNHRRVRIRMLGVKLAGLVQGNMQLSLFSDIEKEFRLQEAMDKIRAKHGNKAVFRAITINSL